jgi:hypothetical protein
VCAQKQRLRELDQQLREAEPLKTDALAAEQRALQAMTFALDHARECVISVQSLLTTAGDSRKLSAQLGLESAERTEQHLRSDHKCACKDSDATGISMCSAVGQDWSAKRKLFARRYSNVQQVKAKICSTEQPPPDVLHSVPHTAKRAREARVALFFMHPEHTGCMPLLMQACFDAAQAVLAPESCASSSEAFPFAAYYSARHLRCPHVQARHIHAAAVEATGSEWVQLAMAEHARSEAPNRKSNVRDYERGDGVWYPDLAQRLHWQGGPVAFQASQVDPFPTPSVDASGAALAHFTEPSSIQRWLSTPAVGESRLTSISQGGSLPALQDASSSDHRLRGNAPLAEQAPPDFRQEQWLKFAALRAFPMTQMHLLCELLQAGHLDPPYDPNCSEV